MMHGMQILGAAMILGACGGETGIGNFEPPPPAPPPVDEERGNAPDWENCFTGWRGQYSNLSIDHPHVNPRPADKPAPTDVTKLDWWDRIAFEQFDATLDHGNNWWPVDEGLEGDPGYFAVRWHAWVRAWEDTTMEFTLGSADDSWVLVDGEPIANKAGLQKTFERERFTVNLDSGQYPIEVYFAHRAAQTSGMSFRVLNGDVSICYPDFEEEQTATN